jgi:hypothetical protein
LTEQAGITNILSLSKYKNVRKIRVISAGRQLLFAQNNGLGAGPLKVSQQLE